MVILAYTLWLTLTSFIIGNAARQAQDEKAIREMQLFKEVPHKLRLGDIKERK